MALRRRKRLAQALRRRLFLQARRVTPYLGVESNGLVFLVDTADSSLGPGLFAKRDRKEMRVLARALEILEREGIGARRTVFVDVGANIGTTTLDALRHGFATVVAFEPEPANFRMLRINLLLNDAEERVRALRVALSDRRGTAMLDVGATSSSKPWIVERGAMGASSGRVAEVETTTLDALVANGELDPAEVGMLWLDVEGHEGHVLAGGTTLLAAGPPLVLELHPRLLARGGRLDELGGLLAEHYDHVVDLRRGAAAPLRPVADVERIVDEYRERGFTDVLACRVRR